jgi:uncharacterized membrane protein
VIPVAPLVAALATLWVALLAAAPYLPVPLAGVVYAFGSVICHQIADRSFHLDAAQLPVCARCVGIYAGAAAGAYAALTSYAARTFTYAARTFTVRDRAAVLASAVPTLATILLEWTGVHSSNVTRAAAGVVVGAVLTAFVLHYVECERPRRSPFSQPAPHI